MVPLGDVLTDPQSCGFYERYSDHPALGIEVPLLTVAETSSTSRKTCCGLEGSAAGGAPEKNSVNPPKNPYALFEAPTEPKA